MRIPATVFFVFMSLRQKEKLKKRLVFFAGNKKKRIFACGKAILP